MMPRAALYPVVELHCCCIAATLLQDGRTTLVMEDRITADRGAHQVTFECTLPRDDLCMQYHCGNLWHCSYTIGVFS